MEQKTAAAGRMGRGMAATAALALAASGIAWADADLTSAKITLSPPSASVLVGNLLTLTATVTRDGQPVAGVPVYFKWIFFEPVRGSGAIITEADGTAKMSYTRTTAATDTIYATLDGDGGLLSTMPQSNTVRVTWYRFQEGMPLRGPSPRALKQQVAAELTALLPTFDKKHDKWLAAAIREVEACLADRLWADDDRLTVLGRWVFRHELNAIGGGIEKMLSDPSLDPGLRDAVQAAVDGLVAADEALALNALPEAMADAGHSRVAQNLIAAAAHHYRVALAVMKGGPKGRKTAIESFQNSWHASQKALGRSPK